MIENLLDNWRMKNNMPIRSKAQQRLMFASAGGYSDKVPKNVADEYIKETPKSRFKKLKERLKKKD